MAGIASAQNPASHPEIAAHSEAGCLGGQMREALARLEQLVLDGLQHGHFRCTISSAIGNGKRRELVIEAGKSDKFTIPENELQR
jgi:hypothetical protein